jgi:hypothetical protein
MVTDFEKVWNVTKVGSLHCTKVTRANATLWFNNYRLMVSLITGVDLDPLEFEDPTGNEDAAKRNRLKMLHYYSFCYVTYARFCQLLKREQAAKYIRDVTLCVEEDEVD